MVILNGNKIMFTSETWREDKKDRKNYTYPFFIYIINYQTIYKFY